MRIGPTPLLLAFIALWFASGCIDCTTATLEPGANLSAIKSNDVVHQPKATHRIHKLTRDRLVKDGLSATAGPELTLENYKMVDEIMTNIFNAAQSTTQPGTP